jgi:hypothetical protein
MTSEATASVLILHRDAAQGQLARVSEPAPGSLSCLT